MKHWSMIGITLIIVSCVQSLYSMNDASKRLVWEIVLTHGICLFDHKMIQSLSLNQDHEALLRETAIQRKNYFIQSRRYVFQDVQNSECEWNKYGSACGKTMIERCLFSDKEEKRHLFIYRYSLGGTELPVVLLWNDFYGYLPHKPKEYFNEQGGLCFYGYGQLEAPVSSDIHVGEPTINEYCFTAHGNKKTYRCMANIKGKKISFELNLAIFLEFPVLLEAFLDSSVVYEYGDLSERVKVYALEGVTIPENYRDHEKYFGYSAQLHIYKSFDELGKSIRKAIIALYKKQHPKKKTKKGLSCLGNV